MEHKTLIKRSQNLRKEATPEEKTLWYQYLRSYPVQWNRQKVIGNYIVDFYCKKANLVIEIDGSQHYEDETIEYDRLRTEYLHTQNIEVIRFTNTDIRKRLRYVCDAIDLEVGKRIRNP